MKLPGSNPQRVWTKEATFVSKSDGVNVRYATLVRPDRDENSDRPCAVVFLPGWKETLYKYEIVLTTIHRRGFDVFAMDHRSQGFSDDAPGTIHEKGYPDGSGRRVCWPGESRSFDDTYVADVLRFFDDVVRPAIGPETPVCLLGHSMGGALAVRVAQLDAERDDDSAPRRRRVDRLALCAPMVRHKNVLDAAGLFDVELPIPLARLAAGLARALRLDRLKADGRDANASLPTTERLTHCPTRAARWNQLRADFPRVVLAGASFGWAGAALEFERRLAKDAADATVPILAFVPEDDAFVYTDATCDLVSATTAGRVPGRTLVVGPVANAYHELLQEIDDVSDAIVDTVCAFAEGGVGGTVGDEARRSADKVPVVRDDGGERWPGGHHSGRRPPLVPVPLLLRDHPRLRKLSKAVFTGMAVGTLLKLSGVLDSKRWRK